MRITRRDKVESNEIVRELGDDVVAIAGEPDPADAVDVLKVTEHCYVFVFQGHDVAGHALALPALFDSVRDKLTVEAFEASHVGVNGALVGIPRADLMIVFVCDTGDFQNGVTNVVLNLMENWEADASNELSALPFWVNGEHVEALGYELDAAGELEAIDLPKQLEPLLG